MKNEPDSERERQASMGILSQDLAQEYARLYRLPPQTEQEAGWAFRKRIAQILEQKGEYRRAHEVLHNKRWQFIPFADGTLDDGYNDTYVTMIAQNTEAVFQQLMYPTSKPPGLLTRFWQWWSKKGYL